VYRQAFGPANLASNPSTLGAIFEHTDTNMGPVETLQIVGRVRASKDAGVPLQMATVPGRKRSGEDAQNEYWVLDDRRLQDVLAQTMR
jgi:anionic cell wall polymer biosynthesis LytR-Cps2A-Psr (LCP) family protein